MGLVHQRNGRIRIYLKGLPFFMLMEGFNLTENSATVCKALQQLWESSQKAEKSVGAAGTQGPKVGLWGCVQADLKFPCQGSQSCLDQRPDSHNSPGTQNLLSETAPFSSYGTSGCAAPGEQHVLPGPRTQSEMQEHNPGKTWAEGGGGSI